MHMDKITEILNKNMALRSDISNHPILVNNFIGILRNIESIVPEECRQNFYKNLELLRLIPSSQSACSIDVPIIYIDEKLLWLADNNKSSDNYNFSDVLVEELYHELLHLFSTSYVVDIDSKKVNGFSGFVVNFIDLGISNNLFNGLTEGFTQYLTSNSVNSNNAKYDIQIECIKKLIDTVGIDAVKQSFFNNKLGLQPIIDRLLDKEMNIDYIYDLEKKCHIDLAPHIISTNNIELNDNITKNH